MITFDLYFLGLIACCVVLGAAFGFGRWLRWLTSGLSGKIISVVVCYFLFGIALNWSFMQALMQKITDALQEDGSWICNALLWIRLDLIVFGAILFVAVQLLRVLAVKIIASVMQMNFKPISVLNRLLGVALLALFVGVVVLIVFQVVFWVLGTETGLYESLQGSAFGLDKLYIDNPLNAIINNIRLEF